MRIVGIGSGAMGSLFGGLLAADGHNVTLVDIWEEHVQTINENGLVISTVAGNEQTIDVDAVTDPTMVESPDLAMIFVKSIHTENAVADAAPILDNTNVITVQNGLGNTETIAEYVPEERVIGGVTSQGAILEGPGRITHAGKGPTSIGRYFRDNDDDVQQIAEHFSAAGIETEVTDTVRDAVWEKVLVNLGINAATALARVRNGMIAEAEPGRKIAEAAVTEGKTVAEKQGRTVREDIVDYVMEIASETASNKSSMRQDLEADQTTEIETLNGEIVRRAKSQGIKTPVNRTLSNLIRLAEHGSEVDD